MLPPCFKAADEPTVDPYSVLSSYQSSALRHNSKTVPPSSQGGKGALYVFASSLAAAALDGLFDHPVASPDVC